MNLNCIVCFLIRKSLFKKSLFSFSDKQKILKSCCKNKLNKKIILCGVDITNIKLTKK